MSLRVYLVIAVSAAMAALALAAAPAHAGNYVKVVCPTSGLTTGPRLDASPQNGWQRGVSANPQTTSGSYPGLQSVTMWTRPDNSFVQLGNSGSDVRNTYWHVNDCGDSGANNEGLWTGNDLRAGQATVFNNDREIAAWWRSPAPIGSPSQSGSTEDVGYRMVSGQYQSQVYGGFNYSYLTTLTLNRQGGADQTIVFANDNYLDYVTGFGPAVGDAAVWRGFIWDSAALVNEGPKPNNQTFNVPAGSQGNYRAHMSGNDSSARLAYSLLARQTCSETGAPGNTNVNASNQCSNQKIGGSDSVRAGLAARNLHYVVQDKEKPVVTFSGSMFSGWRSSAPANLFVQAADDGGGVYSHFTIAQDPGRNNELVSWLDATSGACRYLNAPGQVTNPTAANHQAGTWNTYSTQQGHYGSGGLMLYDTGPCNSQEDLAQTFNPAQTLRQGANTINSCATDYDDNSAINSQLYTFAGQTYSQLYNGDSANQTCAANYVFVDSVPPALTPPAFDGPVVYDPGWTRGTSNVWGWGADPTYGPDLTSNTSDDANRLYGTPMISAAAGTGLQWAVNDGAWSAYGTTNTTAPATPDGIQGVGQQFGSALLANGTKVDMRFAGYDNAGNIGISQTVTKRVDNQAPTDLTSTPAANTGYQSFPVTVRGSDNHSHIYSLTWTLIDGKGTASTSDDTTVQTKTKTVASINDDSDTLSDSLVITNDDHYLLTTVVDQAGNNSGAKVIDPLIDGTPPTLSVQGGSDTWYNTDRTVTYTASDADSGVASIDWSVTSGARPASVAASGQFLCASPPCGLAPATMQRTQTFTAEQDLRLSATATDSFAFGANTSTAVPYRVRIDKTPPNVTVTRPQNGSSPAGPGVELRALSVDPNLATGDPASGPAAGTFEICSVSGGGNCNQATDWNEVNQASAPNISPPLCRASLSTTGGLYRCNLDSRQYGNGVYRLRLKGYDAAGNWARSPEIEFTITNADLCPIP